MPENTIPFDQALTAVRPFATQAEAEAGVNITNAMNPLRVKQAIAAQVETIHGEDGKSAYEIWIEEGNSGTEEDFLDSLKGADGEPGVDGWRWRGEYSADTVYYFNDVLTVTKAGLLYICIEDDPEGVVGKNPITSTDSFSYITGFYFDPEGKAGGLMVYNPVTETIEVSDITDDVVVTKGEPLIPENTTDGLIMVFDENMNAKDIGIDSANLMLNLNGFVDGELIVFDQDGQPNPSGKTIEKIKTELKYLYCAPAAFESRKTNGAAWTTEESTTYDQTRSMWLFDASTSEGIQIIIPNYGSGSLITENFKFRLHLKMLFTATELTAPNNTCSFRCKAAIEKATSDVEWGSAVAIVQSMETGSSIQVTEWSNLITASGELTDDTRLIIDINRYADDATNDLIAQDVALIGVEFYFNL